MRKLILLFIFVFVLFMFTTQTLFGENLKLLQMKAPMDSKKFLLVNLDDLKVIIAEADLKDVSADIELTDLMGNVLATLGKIKNNDIKWSHNIVNDANGSSLQVKFKDEDFDILLEKIKKNDPLPGIQVRIAEHKRELAKASKQEYLIKAKYEDKIEIFKNWEITLTAFRDLTVTIDLSTSPSFSPGAESGKYVSLNIENKGTIEARDVDVELVLSSNLQIPVKPALYSENFQEDVLLKDGKEKIESLKPGQRLTLSLKGSAVIPPDTPPGQYYLGAVVDPENKIVEADEENNFNAKFIMITALEPASIVLDMPDTLLIYEPATFGLNIECRGLLLSNGSDWRKCKIKPYIHQLKEASWKDFHWEINTTEKSAWRVKNAEFCKPGGDANELKMKMEVQGGSNTMPPSRVTLKLPDTRLEFEPASGAGVAGKFSIMICGVPSAHVPSWNVARPAPHLYQFRYTSWQDFFLEVDTVKKQVSRVTGGNFGVLGGTPTVLDIAVRTTAKK